MTRIWVLYVVTAGEFSPPIAQFDSREACEASREVQRIVAAESPGRPVCMPKQVQS